MFHLNPKTGNPNRCTAKEGNCPFGADAPHFESKDAARESYEYSQLKDGYLDTLRKTRKDLAGASIEEEPPAKTENPHQATIDATAKIFAEPFRASEPTREREYYKGLHDSVVEATAKAFRQPRNSD